MFFTSVSLIARGQNSSNSGQTLNIFDKFEATTINSDGSKTFTDTNEWGWFGAWFGDFDASEYEYFVLEIAPTSEVGVQVVIQYNDNGADDINYLGKKSDFDLSPYSIIALDPERKKHIKQIGLQNTDSGSFTITDAYFAVTPKEVYAVLSDDSETITFYYDTKKESRGGINLREYLGASKAIFDESIANYRPYSVSMWFYNNYNLKEIIGLKNLNTVTVRRMTSMFDGCNSLTSLDLSSFNTENVTDMNSMFKGCNSLTSLDLSNFNTENVTDMRGMFRQCSSLTSLDLSNFNTSSVTNMVSMFLGCSSLTSLNLSSFNTANVTDMSSMFSSCKALTSLDLSSFSTANVTDMSSMFKSCKALTSLDLSSFNTENVTDMNSMFNGCNSLTSLNLSSFNTENVTDMSYMFYNCKALTSLDLSCFNTANVKYMDGMFSGCSALISIYADDTKWNAEHTRASNMFTNCTNLVGGNETVYDKSHINYEYARIDLPGQPGYFTDIQSVGSAITMKVTDDAGNIVTSNATITWYDASGKQIGMGSKLNGVAEDAEVYYSVELAEALGRVYREVSLRKAEAEDGVVTCQLEKIGRVELQGRVSGTDIDKTTVTVNAHQLLNGKWEQDYTTQADDQGQFNIEVYDDVTDITLSGDGYLNATVHRDGFGGNGNVGTIPISLLTGFAVVANITMTKAVAAGEAAESTLLTDRLTEIDFTLTNQTKGTQLTDVAVQNGSIVIKSGAAVGDKISLTAKSKQGVFADASTTFTLVEGTNSFDLQVKELGGIEATCTASNNGTTVGYLYDRNNVLATKGTYQGETLSLLHLKNGIYTLVTMGQSLLLGNMTNLSDLRKVGLTEGTDYVTTRISVTDGLLASASISQVPHMDDTPFYYTNGNTYLNADKASVTAGNYLILRAHIGFKAEHADKAGNVTLAIDLPEGCQMVENSVIANRKPVAYTVNGQRVTMQLSKEQYESEVRFCVIPTQHKNYTVTAIAQFNIGGNVQQPIGTAQFEAKGLSLYAPKLTASTNVTVTGTAQPNSEVSVYDNDVLVGTTTSKADGTWTAQCELFKPYSPSFHDIYAKIATGDGLELTSEMKRVEYDNTNLAPSSVLMTYYNGWYKKNFEITFDLLNGTPSETSYPYYTATDFTFLADFTRNDPERISNVNIRVLNSDGTVRNLPATFDDKQGKWVATSKYANASRLPQNVMVEYDLMPASVYDEERGKAVNNIINNMLAEVDNAYKDCKIEVISEDEKSVFFTATTNGYETKENFNITLLDYESVKAEYANEPYAHIKDETTDMGFVIKDLDNNSKLVVWNNIDKTALEICSGNVTNAKEARARRILPLLISATYGVGTSIYEYHLRMKEIKMWQQTLESEKEMSARNYKKMMDLLYAKCPEGGSYKIKFPNVMNSLRQDAENFSSENNLYLEEFEKKINLQKSHIMNICILKGLINVGMSLVFSGAGNLAKNLSLTVLKKLGDNGITAISELTGDLLSDKIGNGIEVEEIVSNWHSDAYKELMNKYASICKNIKSNYSKCREDKDDDDKGDEATDDHSGFPGKGTTPIIDPSGFVYEAVLSNRLEGVTTTCYQQVGGSAVQWNAEDYSQQNPLVTDETGFYRWDVPQGMWQVKYEKEGYETAYSDWLPVPPPQLDVNISMKQSTPPTVKEMHGYETGIVIEMGKYMLPGTMTTKNITVTCNGKTVSGAIELMNSEESPLGDETYVSKVKFVPKDNFSSSDVVVVTVHKEVESYCGVTMAADHVETVKIEPEIKSIVADETVTVPYQGEHELRVVVLPKDAAAGKTLRVSTSSEIIASVNETEVEIGQDGTATIVLGGELPGGAVLEFSIDGTDVTATTKVQVAMESDMAETPTANIASGETITSGTTLTLSCGTPGATIYYTLDGSCPCDEATRLLYEGPIVLSSDAVVKAIAVCEGLDDSDVATFVYVVTGIGNSLADTGVRVGCHGRTVTVTGAEGASCWIYDLRGGEVAHRSNLSRQAKFDVKAAGVYLVCIRPKKGQPMVAKIVVR